MGFVSKGVGCGSSFYFELPLYSSETSKVEPIHLNQLKPPPSDAAADSAVNTFHDSRHSNSQRLKSLIGASPSDVLSNRPGLNAGPGFCSHSNENEFGTLLGVDILVPNFDMEPSKEDSTDEEFVSKDVGVVLKHAPKGVTSTLHGQPVDLKPFSILGGYIYVCSPPLLTELFNL